MTTIAIVDVQLVCDACGSRLRAEGERVVPCEMCMDAAFAEGYDKRNYEEILRNNGEADEALREWEDTL